MTYATRTDLENRYGVDDIAQRESVLTPGAIERALADATSEADTYLASRYALPVSPVPAALLRVTCAIARYYLLGDAATDIARQQYKDAVSWLKDLESGRVHLDGATMLTGGSAGVVRQQSAARVFGRDSSSVSTTP